MAAPQRPVPPTTHPPPPSKDRAYHAHVRLDSVRSAKHGGTAEKTVRSSWSRSGSRGGSRWWPRGKKRARSLHAKKPSGGRGGRKGRLAAGVGEKNTLRGVKSGSAGPRVCNARHRDCRACAAPPHPPSSTGCSGAHSAVHLRAAVGGGPLTAPPPTSHVWGGRWWHVEDDSRPPTRPRAGAWRRPPSGSPFWPF